MKNNGIELTEIEREQLIFKEADLYIRGYSYREIKKKLIEDGDVDTISHVSVMNQLRTLEETEPELFVAIKEMIEENTPKSVNDPMVQTRMVLVYKLLVCYNYTIDEIYYLLENDYSEEFELSVNTVYRDLRLRLPMFIQKNIEITESIKDIVDEILSRYGLNNADNYDRNYPDKITNNEYRIVKQILEYHRTENLNGQPRR